MAYGFVLTALKALSKAPDFRVQTSSLSIAKMLSETGQIVNYTAVVLMNFILRLACALSEFILDNGNERL